MKKELFITDLDGTLTKGSLVLEHCGFLIARDIIKDDGSYQAWTKDKKNESLIFAVAENYRYQITGKTIPSLLPTVFVHEFLSRSHNWYKTLERLQIELSRGNDVIMITGSSHFLAETLSNELGFTDCFATKYHVNENKELTGEIDGMFNEQAKDDCIQYNINIAEYSKVTGLGDTASDNGIFKHSDYIILVEPTIETLTNIKHSIDETLYY